MQAGGG
ncbi:unnamed protein product [Lathyrus sativus]|nr:unnamed protein product [Lathyrus sativus]